ncbi:MAG: helix-turn-helix transcriptional regulator [Verrucomicrobiota bacterium]
MQSSFQRENLERLAIQANYDGRILANLCGISPRQLQRLFKSTLGCSPQEWLIELKVFQAKVKLLAREPVKKVALDLNYKHASHFCYQFKSVVGMTPSEFAFLHRNS